MNRKREQAEIIYLLGRLLGPFEQAVSNPSRFDSYEQERIKARFLAELPMFYNQAVSFCNGEPHHRYGRQHNSIAQCYNDLNAIATDTPHIEDILSLLQAKRERIVDEILSIPIPVDSIIYEAETPFSTYCFVKDLCTTVSQQLTWSDRYFDHTIFHRYFYDTSPNAVITLVTSPGANLTGRDKTRYTEFMNVSRLFAVERGSRSYRLIENAAFHDRWLRCDDNLFTLGGSIKDITKGPFTISRLDATPSNQQIFDDAVSVGTEIFGPTSQNHP